MRQSPARPPLPLRPRRGSSGSAAAPGGYVVVKGESAGRREEIGTALEVLTGLVEHESCVPLTLESEGLEGMLQVLHVRVLSSDNCLNRRHGQQRITPPSPCLTNASAEYGRLLEILF